MGIGLRRERRPTRFSVPSEHPTPRTTRYAFRGGKPSSVARPPWSAVSGQAETPTRWQATSGTRQSVPAGAPGRAVCGSAAPSSSRRSGTACATTSIGHRITGPGAVQSAFDEKRSVRALVAWHLDPVSGTHGQDERTWRRTPSDDAAGAQPPWESRRMASTSTIAAPSRPAPIGRGNHQQRVQAPRPRFRIMVAGGAVPVCIDCGGG